MQVSLVNRCVRGTRIEPQQRLPPALAGSGAFGAIARKLLQTRNPVPACGVTIGEVLRISERVTRIIRILLGELLQTPTRLIPALWRRRQRLVILELQFGRGRLAFERALILLHSAGGLAALLQTPRIVDGLVTHTAFAKPASQFVDSGVVRRGFPQTGQILLRSAAVLAIGEHHAHAEQRIRLLRINAQHFLPGLFGEVATVMGLPVLALIDQDVKRVA